jgi:hypothetical protein
MSPLIHCQDFIVAIVTGCVKAGEREESVSQEMNREILGVVRTSLNERCDLLDADLATSYSHAQQGYRKRINNHIVASPTVTISAG